MLGVICWGWGLDSKVAAWVRERLEIADVTKGLDLSSIRSCINVLYPILSGLGNMSLDGVNYVSILPSICIDAASFGRLADWLWGGNSCDQHQSGQPQPSWHAVVSNSTMAFGNVALGSSTAQTGKLTAATSAVTISSASWNGDAFSVSGITFPVTLKAGQSAPFTVTFAPQAAGSVSGRISFLSNAANSPTTEIFTGTGSQSSGPAPHSVSMSWSPSPSAVIGYNVYRGTTSGGPYPSKLTPSPQAGTSLVDNTVAAG